MAVTTSDLKADDGAREPQPLDVLVLARTACDKGATRAEVIRDLGGIVAHKLSPAAWRTTADATLARLSARGLVTGSRGRFTATEAGAAEMRRLAGSRAIGLPWSQCREVALVAMALGVPPLELAMSKALATPQGLSAAILQKAFGLAINPRQSQTRLRAELAVVALERAFGNKIKSGLGQAGSGLSAKAGRLLAGHLSRTPKDYGSDGRLIAHLAAEKADAPGTDDAAVRLAVLRGYLARGVVAEAAASPAVVSEVRAAPDTRPPLQRPANDAAPAAAAAGLAARPDLPTFAREVQRAAATCAEGWPGNRKAYISHAFAAISRRRADWALSDIEFKCMLAEAHRAGHLMLANADLKSKASIPELEASAILYKNTVWHFVRVED